MPTMISPSRGSLGSSPVGRYQAQRVQPWEAMSSIQAQAYADQNNRNTENQFASKQFDADMQLGQAQAMRDMTAFDRQSSRDEAEKDRQLQILLAQIREGGQWDELMFNSGNGLLGSIAGKGYIDSGQHASAAGRYAGLSGDIAKQRGVMEGVQKQGLFSPEEMSKIMGGLDAAGSTAADLARTGGVDGNYQRGADGMNSAMGAAGRIANDGGVDDNYHAGAAGMRQNMDRLSGVAANGKYSADEVNQMESAAKSEVEDRYRAAASSAYNTPGGVSTSPFAAASLLEKGASEGGKARAGVKAGITREQADSRMQGAQSAAQIGSGLGELSLGLGRNKLQGASLQGQLGGALGEMGLGLGRNKLQGAGLQSNIAQAIASVYGKNADGKMDAGRMIQSLLGMDSGVADRLSNLDTSTMPSYVRDILNTAMKERDEIALRRSSGQGGTGGGTYLPGGSTSREYQNKRGNWVTERTTTGPWKTKQSPGMTTWGSARI